MNPPRVARHLVRLLLSSAKAERLLADLGDEFADMVRAGTLPRRARRWYWSQAIRSIAPLWVRPSRRRRGRALEAISRDVRQALRSVRRSPAHFTLTVATLTLGIGANSALFAVLDSVLLAPLPYSQPERILRAWAHTEDGDITDFTFRVAEHRDLVEHAEVFEAVGGDFPIAATVAVGTEAPRQLQGRRVTSDFFDVFGVRPRFGRAFDREEIEGGTALLVIVSHRYFEEALGGDPNTVGTAITVDGNPFTVVGVLPESFIHPSASEADLYIPYTIGTEGWVARWLDLYLRVRPGVDPERAREAVQRGLDRVAETNARSAGWVATVEPLHEMVVGDVRTALWAVFGTAALVFLIACVNGTNLALARNVTRGKEMRLRRALGAGRIELLRHLLVENGLVALVSGVLSIGVVLVSVRGIVAWSADSIPRMNEVSIGWRGIAFCGAMTVAAGVLFGLVSALGSQRSIRGARLTEARGTTEDRGSGRLLGGLVSSQVALATTLVVGAGLLITTYQALLREDLGIDREGRTTFRVSAPATRYPSAESTHEFYRRFRSELASLPGVTAVGAGSDLPVSGEGAVAGLNSEARILAGESERITALQRRATEGFFEAMGTEILFGRGFDDRIDTPESEPVLVLSATLAERLLPGIDPIGRRVAFASDPAPEDWMTVIGVVSDVRYTAVERASDPQLYQAHAQSTTRDMAMVVRTSDDPGSLEAAIRARLATVDNQIPLYGLTTFDTLVSDALADRRLVMRLFSVFALVALSLTLAGIFGVLSYAVGQRRREIGVRIALGASGSKVRRMVVGRGLGLVGIGLIVGLGGAAFVYRLAESLFFGVSAFDSGTYVLGALLLLLTGAGAAYLPALRASSVDPMTALEEG